jgi:hypothetical protein
MSRELAVKPLLVDEPTHRLYALSWKHVSKFALGHEGVPNVARKL